MNDESEWEAKYQSMLDTLASAETPSALLEERTVAALRQRGLLRRARRLPSAWLVGSIAASLALFATGVVVGQWLGTRTAVNAVAQIAQSGNADAAAAQVQETGTAYVRALETLVNNASQAQGQPQSAEAREVALTALHAAANEVVRLAPNDPVVMKILQGIEQARVQKQPRAEREPQRKIVWF